MALAMFQAGVPASGVVGALRMGHRSAFDGLLAAISLTIIAPRSAADAMISIFSPPVFSHNIPAANDRREDLWLEEKYCDAEIVKEVIEELLVTDQESVPRST